MTANKPTIAAFTIAPAVDAAGAVDAVDAAAVATTAAIARAAAATAAFAYYYMRRLFSTVNKENRTLANLNYQIVAAPD